MGDIFSNIGLPSWLQSPSGPALAEQQQRDMSQKLSNFSDLARMKMAQKEQDVLLPLKQQEYGFKLQEMAFDIQGRQIAMEGSLKAKQAITNLSEKLLDTKDWASPDALRPVFEVAQTNPSLFSTPQGQAIVKQVELNHQIAATAKARTEVADIQAESRAKAAEQRSLDLELRSVTAENIAKERNVAVSEWHKKHDEQVAQNHKLQLESAERMAKLKLEIAGYDAPNHIRGNAAKAEMNSIMADPALTVSEKILQIERIPSRYGVTLKNNATSPKVAPTDFQTPTDVVRAYNGGKGTLTWDEARKILADKFGLEK